MILYRALSITIILILNLSCGNIANSNLKNESNLVKNQNSQILNNAQTDLLQSQQIPKDLLITIERTGCNGSCPVYNLRIKADGSVSFEGIKYTETKGKAEGKISEDKIRQILKEFANANYFSLKDKYDGDNCPQTAKDHPTVITSIQIGNKTKTVNHNRGCEENSAQPISFPPKLTEMENKIDEIVETKRWIEVSK
ncbi:hypothetical protein BH10ACI1_BH10ACI1_01480 [soil metagenome]